MTLIFKVLQHLTLFTCYDANSKFQGNFSTFLSVGKKKVIIYNTFVQCKL